MIGLYKRPFDAVAVMHRVWTLLIAVGRQNRRPCNLQLAAAGCCCLLFAFDDHDDEMTNKALNGSGSSATGGDQSERPPGRPPINLLLDQKQ